MVTGLAAPPEPTARQVAGRRFRTARGVVLALAALIIVAIALAALKPTARETDLDPASPSPGGSRALAEILRQHGTPVTVARSARQAAELATSDSVTLVTRGERLTPAGIDRLRAAPGDLFLVQPTQDMLAALAPGVDEAGPSFERTGAPGCAVRAAILAGDVEFGRSETYNAPAGAASCYVSGGHPRLVQLPVGSRTVTVLGAGAPLANDMLDSAGNAALAMDVAGARASVVWLIPDLPPPGDDSGRKSLGELVPFGVKLFFLELLVAVALLALWRARRLGPVVAEALPVVVRSAETAEGRARLYRAHRARDRAADALRSGVRERLVPLLGLPRGAAQDPAAATEIVTAVALRTTHDQATVHAALYGPAPDGDAALVALSDLLDDLERQVRES
ncbi:DUF4350 domain-containing protein [Actinomadura parmotrematis]|uniref:DUF4350 domain-containing protein n=1 Tax=Actinomadura parmotrematis TaxID=2864039 RepID=A0ABS7FX70_9ACTN|nr:DUF4350 domain-containing protein [Actinomadura parmotrematis]MBW8484575.1 DUF4350 domain-containing protein [Actinomadura parmotrematis]